VTPIAIEFYNKMFIDGRSAAIMDLCIQITEVALGLEKSHSYNAKPTIRELKFERQLNLLFVSLSGSLFSQPSFSFGNIISSNCSSYIPNCAIFLAEQISVIFHELTWAKLFQSNTISFCQNTDLLMGNNHEF
jgi:hypothetical protein